MFKINNKPLWIAIISFLLGHLFMEYLGFSMIWHGIYMLCFAGLFVNSAKSQNNIFVFRAIVPIVIGLGLVCAYRYLYQIGSVSEFLGASKSNQFHLERLFESLSTLYAICTAFLLWKGMDDHDNLKRILKEEAGQIQGIIGYLNYLDEKRNKISINNIRINFKLYIERIIQDDKIQAHEENYQLLSDTRTFISKLSYSSGIEKTAVFEVMRGLNNLFKIRIKRISLMDSHLSPYILIALSFMSLSIIYVVFTTPPSEAIVVDIIIFILGTLLSFMLMMLIDIGSPFEGYWKIKTDSFSQIKVILSKEIAKGNK